jgi:hypothetical protein
MHADSLDNVVKRLTSPPMNVAKVYIPLMNSALHVQRVELPQEKEGLSFGRRVRNVWEIEEYDQYREVAVWNPRNDTFETWFEDSYLLERIAAGSGQTKQDLLTELDARTKFLSEIVKEGVRDQKLVAERILSYYIKKRGEKGEKSPRKTRQKKKKQKRVGEPSKKHEDPGRDDAIGLFDDEEEPEPATSPNLGRAASLGSRVQSPNLIESKDEADQVG